MNKSPLVTVYITTKNRCGLLSRAIDSVLSQTWDNIEIIVCDDASTDETPAVVARYMEAHENIVSVRNEVSKGACYSRNQAIKLARGEFITGLDDDDYFTKGRIETLLAAYQDKYAFVCAAYYRKTNDGQRAVKDGVGTLSLNDLLHYNKVGNQVFTKTERFRAVQGFDERLPSFQDYDMWIRLLAQYGTCLKLAEPLYVLDISHESERISANLDRVRNGYQLFYDKHSPRMSQAHLNSMVLLQHAILKQPLSLLKAIKLCNAGNYKSVINQILKNH